MAKRSLEYLTETMFYILMAFQEGPLCGTEVAALVEERSRGRVLLGPATLYTVLGKFEQEKYIKEIKVDGRKRTYEVTEKGREAYKAEVLRLKTCIYDAENVPMNESEKREGILWA